MFEEDAGAGGLAELADGPQEPLGMHSEHGKQAQGQKPPVALTLFPQTPGRLLPNTDWPFSNS